MILEAAISNICHRLDLLQQNVASNTKLKQESVACLAGLIKAAPQAEYDHLLESDSSQLVLGYLIHTLCQFSASEKSRPLRQESLELLLVLFERLESVHTLRARDGLKCPLHLVGSALPGVSSTMFKLLMSDTKLPTRLLATATRVLASIIRLSFLPDCIQHQSPILCDTPKALDETCANLSVRLHLLINYVTQYGQQLGLEVSLEMLNLCETLVGLGHIQLISKLVSAIVRYIAFVSSDQNVDESTSVEIDLKVTHLVTAIKNSQQDCDESILTGLFKLLDELDENSLSMLSSERHAALSMLYGYLRLLKSDGLTTLLELQARRRQLFGIFLGLSEFDVQNPLLFVTDRPIDGSAIETYGTQQLFTSEKRFAHIETREADLLKKCYNLIGECVDWRLGDDILRNDLGVFNSSSALFVAHQVIVGYINRDKNTDLIEKRVQKLTSHYVEFYVDKIQEMYTLLKQSIYFNPSAVCCAEQILRIVISIETLVTLVELRLKFCLKQSNRIVILRTLLCPLLTWSSSDFRTISESALNGLIQVAQCYGHDSIKPLIESHTDYIVDGIGKMLDNYTDNFEVANVLAVTFKLSSIDTFFYFKDIYERVFKTLGAYHTHADHCKPVALLFYRTLTILNQWKKVSTYRDWTSPLSRKSDLNSIAHEIDIERRILELERKASGETPIPEESFAKEVDQNQSEREVIDELKSGEIPRELHTKSEEERDQIDSAEEVSKEKSIDVALSEKIVGHCINLISSQDTDTRVLAMKAVAEGFSVLREDEDTLLPLVHQTWAPLVQRLTGDYSSRNLEVNLCAFECLISMATNARDFIKRRTLDSIIPRMCLFLESQARLSNGTKDYEPYCLTLDYKCQLRLLTDLGPLAYHLQLGYTSLWRLIKTALIYLDPRQVPALQSAARTSLEFMFALDPDCVWYFMRQSGQLDAIPFKVLFKI